ncbi:MAG: HlyD family secretion protein [Bryobacteraceae bacterium]
MTAEEKQTAPETQGGVQTAASAGPKSSAPSNTAGRRRAFTVFFVVLVLAGIAGFFYWHHSRLFETTDDAQVDAHLNPVTSRVDGTITAVHVDDNQTVQAGAPLVDLDPRDFQVSLDQALAELSQAQSMVIAERPNLPITEVQNVTSISGAEADVATARAALAVAERDREASAAKLSEAEANNARAQADLARYRLLIAKEEVSQQEYDQVVAAAKAQAATVKSNQAGLEAAVHTVDQRRAQITQSETKLDQYRRTASAQVAIRRANVQSNQASAKSASAQVEAARLKLSYANITAPVAGIVMKRSAEIGSHISAGQQLMQIAQIGDIWVTANFKETQLRSIRPNQSASIHVDALKRDFEGYVETIGGSTGSVASVLPPENATGNYVKVVQRIPVRIRFKPNQHGLDLLRPGMSVEPDVRVGG